MARRIAIWSVSNGVSLPGVRLIAAAVHSHAVDQEHPVPVLFAEGLCPALILPIDRDDVIGEMRQHPLNGIKQQPVDQRRAPEEMEAVGRIDDHGLSPAERRRQPRDDAAGGIVAVHQVDLLLINQPLHLKEGAEVPKKLARLLLNGDGAGLNALPPKIVQIQSVDGLFKIGRVEHLHAVPLQEARVIHFKLRQKTAHRRYN